MARSLRLPGTMLASLGLILPLVAVVPPAVADPTPTVTAVRAAHHPGYDRLVLQFSGAVPTVRAAWKPAIIDQNTGKRIAVAGHAFALITMTPAQGHTDAGRITLPGNIKLALPELKQLGITEDFEALVSIGIGVQRHTSLHISRLTTPAASSSTSPPGDPTHRRHLPGGPVHLDRRLPPRRSGFPPCGPFPPRHAFAARQSALTASRSGRRRCR